MARVWCQVKLCDPLYTNVLVTLSLFLLLFVAKLFTYFICRVLHVFDVCLASVSCQCTVFDLAMSAS